MGTIAFRSPRWGGLTPDTRLALDLVADLPFISRFYLAGITGLALHLGHRYSIDLDFFSEDANSVGPDERASVREALEDPALVIEYDKDATFVANWRGVGVSFFRLQFYPLVQPRMLLGSVPVATVQEIGAMKLAAIIGRGTRKDLVDLCFILRYDKLESLFAVAARKYTRVRSFAASATCALAYFEDAEALPMPRMIDSTPWETMKSDLEKQAMEAGRKHLADLWD